MPGVPATTSLIMVVLLILLYVLGGFFYRWRLSAERAQARTEELQAEHDALAAVVLLQRAGPPVPPADTRHLRVVNGSRAER
jgi:type II secretory pathway pseudopilin PulG